MKKEFEDLFKMVETESLTLWSRVLLDKMIFAQLAKKFPSFIEPEVSLPYSQEPATGPCPEPDESSPRPHTLFIFGPF
jgi:hypothetical protein